jgi:hypothetical protein
MYDYIYLFNTDDSTVFRLYLTNDTIDKPMDTILLQLMVQLTHRFEYVLMTEMTRLFKTHKCVHPYHFEGEPVEMINTIYKVWHTFSRHIQPVYPKNGLIQSVKQHLQNTIRNETATIAISREELYKSYPNPYCISIRKFMSIVRNDFKCTAIKIKPYKKLTHLFIIPQLLHYQLNQLPHSMNSTPSYT